MGIRRGARGLWYFVVVIFSAGMLAALPFAHAAIRLRRPALRWWTACYVAAAVTVLVLISSSPSEQGELSPADEVSAAIGTAAMFVIVLVACIHLVAVRREVNARADAPPKVVDPAISAALAVLARRTEARELVENNPELARDLRIGRPDLPRQYDDGGLVDINAVPSVLIAQECGLDAAAAEQIQSARQRHLVPFGSVDELLVFAGLDVSTWDRLRDRAVVYS